MTLIDLNERHSDFSTIDPLPRAGRLLQIENGCRDPVRMQKVLHFE